MKIRFFYHLSPRKGEKGFSEPPLHPATIHLELFSAVHQHPPIDAEFQDIKLGTILDLILLLSRYLLQNFRAFLFAFSSKPSPPNSPQLLLPKKVDPRPIPPDVKILLHPSPLAEPHLCQVASSVISKTSFSAWLQCSVDIAHCLRPLAWTERAEDEDQKHDVDAVLLNHRGKGLARNIPHLSIQTTFIVVRRSFHDLYRLTREVARMDHQLLILICLEHRKRRVPSPGTDLQDALLPRSPLRHSRQDGKFLLQPFPVFEEIRRVVGIEPVPPFGWIAIETVLVKSGDGRGALEGVLRFGVREMCRRRWDVVPGVEGVGVGGG